MPRPMGSPTDSHPWCNYSLLHILLRCRRSVAALQQRPGPPGAAMQGMGWDEFAGESTNNNFQTDREGMRRWNWPLFQEDCTFLQFFLRLAIKFHWSWGFPTICWGYLVDVPRQLDEEGQRNLQSCDADHPAVIPLGHAGNIKWISLYISGDIMCIYIYVYTLFTFTGA